MVVKGEKHPWILSHNPSAFQRFPKCLIHHCPRPWNYTICPQSRKLRKGKSFDFWDFVSWFIAQLPSYHSDVCFSPPGSGCAHTRALLQVWAEYRDRVWTKGRSPFSWVCPVRPSMASVFPASSPGASPALSQPSSPGAPLIVCILGSTVVCWPQLGTLIFLFHISEGDYAMVNHLAFLCIYIFLPNQIELFIFFWEPLPQESTK